MPGLTSPDQRKGRRRNHDETKKQSGERKHPRCLADQLRLVTAAKTASTSNSNSNNNSNSTINSNNATARVGTPNTSTRSTDGAKYTEARTV